MNIRLVGSAIVSSSFDIDVKSSKTVEFLVSLPKHCFAQLISSADSFDTIILVYSFDKDFDFDEWFDSFKN